MWAAMSYERLSRPRPQADAAPSRPVEEDRMPAPARPVVDLDKLFATARRRDEGLIPATPEAQLLANDPDRSAVTALGPSIILWIQRIDMASSAVDAARQNPDRTAGEKRIDEVIEKLQDDGIAGFVRETSARPRVNASQLRLAELVAATVRLTGSVELANQQFGPDRFSVTRFRGDVESTLSALGIDPARPPVSAAGPHLHAAFMLLPAALEEAQFLEQELDAQRPGSQIEGRRSKWFWTVRALASAVADIPHAKRVLLKADARKLSLVFAQLMQKSRNGAIAFDASSGDIQTIVQTLR